MRTLNDLIDRAKAAARLTSDYKLAKHLAIAPARIYAWRSERRIPTAEHILNLAEMAGDNPAYWIIWLQARKATTHNLASRFKRVAEQISV